MTVERWPALPLAQWEDTRATLHLWTQIVGKVRLALAPMVNHWWQAPLYVSARGLTTSAIPYAGGVVELTFDFQDEVLRIRTSAGASRAVALAPRTVADFHGDVLSTLLDVGVRAHITRTPVEMENVIPFDEDETHASFDAEAARRFWRVLIDVDRVLNEFRGGFIGKCSPVHFWWGSFDIAVTRFSGRTAPQHPGGIPNVADYVMQEAYSHECMSVGWWPGGGLVPEPAFYAYSYPEPDGCSAAQVSPSAAYYHPEMREWILPYEAARTAQDPDAEVMSFLESTYGTVARFGNWDRAALDRAT